MLAFLEEGTWLRDVGLPILLTVVVAIVATLILRVVVGRFKRKLEQAPHLSEAGNLQRAATLAHALSATFVVVVWVVAAMLILNYLDVPLAPFIASAGIVGVALGFGAQSIVKDTLDRVLHPAREPVRRRRHRRDPHAREPDPGAGRVAHAAGDRAPGVRRHAAHRPERQHRARQQQVARLGPRDRRHAHRVRAGPRAGAGDPRRAVRRAPGRAAEGPRDRRRGSWRALRARRRDHGRHATS